MTKKVMYGVGRNIKDINQLHNTLKNARAEQEYQNLGHVGKHHIYKTDPNYKSRRWGDLKWIRMK